MKKIIATGKGGAGKTTVVSTLAKLLAADGYRIMVIDTDPSMNLAMTLGVPFDRLATLADHKADVRERLGAGDEEEDDDACSHHETRESDIDEIISTFTILTGDKIRVMVMGTVPYGGAGCICSSIALVKLVIGALERTKPFLDYVIVDSQAGSEVLGRGLAADYDLNLVVTEATPKAIDVARHMMKLARDISVKRQIVVANKAEGGKDVSSIVQRLDVMPGDVYPVSYDRMVLEADKQARMLDEIAPDSPVLRDMGRIRDAITE